MAEVLSPLIDPFIVARLKQSVDEASRYRLIRRSFDVDAWIDRRYLDAAIAELGLRDHWTAYDAGGMPLGGAEPGARTSAVSDPRRAADPARDTFVAMRAP